MRCFFSKSVDYGFRAVLFLAQSYEDDRFVSLSEIVEHQGVPGPHVSKILQALVRAEIVRSQKGQAGGFRLARAPEEISLLELIESIDGRLRLMDCTQHPFQCLGVTQCELMAVCRQGTQLLQHLFAQTSVARCAFTAASPSSASNAS